MRLPEIIIVAAGLSLDACAIAIAAGFAVRRLHLSYALRLAVFFGLAQMLMPVLGWGLGQFMRGWMSAFADWIAFLVLTGVGLKMIYEAFYMQKTERTGVCIGSGRLLILALATSMDALAVGFSLALLEVTIITPALVIGVVTFLFSLAGAYIGNHFGHFFENRMEIAGGVILVLLGLRILFRDILCV